MIEREREKEDKKKDKEELGETGGRDKERE